MVLLKVYRGTPGNQYWETFSIKPRHGMNVISALLDIQKNPVTIEGKKTTPVAFESGCLEEVCGSCSMLINGVPRQACSALLENILAENGSDTITLAPFTKFPLIRDLVVDRAHMFETLKKIKAWVEIDNYIEKGEGPLITPEKQAVMYSISQCMTCGCCLEGCPQVHDRSNFIGAAAIAQVRLLSIHPTGRRLHPERLRVLQGKGGISGCGNAHNCQRLCPKKIPLSDSLAVAGRETMIRAIKDLFDVQESE
jgi:succinate dehydrogenase / fumarate reductase iron-sulfur subunit